MERKYLIVNIGSESKKYSLYEDGKELFFLHLEKDKGVFISTILYSRNKNRDLVTDKEYNGSVEYFLNLLLEKRIMKDKGEIRGVGLRIVSPGLFFLNNRVIDDKYVKKLKSFREAAPLHIEPVLDEIKKLGKILGCAPIVGVSDSYFHRNLLPEARLYAIPIETAREFQLYRYGYHGISVQSIMHKIKEMFGTIPARVIVCHLGGGSSVTALLDGESVDTSMGFTPLEGIPMATRVGDIDAGAVAYLMKKGGLKLKNFEKYFYGECGLLGMSKRSSDLRILLREEKRGDDFSQMAIDGMVYKIKKYIGSYTAVLNGLDLLVFSGTIGERSDEIRSRVCAGLGGLGIVLDQKKNEQPEIDDNFIHEKDGDVKVAVIKTNEMEEMAKITKRVLGEGK